jgi:hypothetical protein
MRASSRRADPRAHSPRRRLLQGSWLAGALLLLSGCTRDAGVGPAAIAGQQPDATVEMSMAQAAYISSAGGGRSVLRFRGRSYPFRVGGAGIGGIGASTIEAQGDVYNLRNVAEFGGTYAQARYGIAVGNASSGEFWLQNNAGVIMRLNARHTGLMLSMGGDAVVISLDSLDSDRSWTPPALIARLN